MSEPLNIGVIAGVGTDIVDVARIRNMLEKYGDSFLEKTFTEAEIEKCKTGGDSAQKFAARFAAKEAMAKALGTGFYGKITMKSLSVENDKLGAPHAVLDENALARLAEIGASKMSVSISHLKDFAIAFAAASK